MNWTPVTFDELHKLIFAAEENLEGEISNFWQTIKVYPEKWREETHGTEGDGFWIVGLIGRRVIYYNDIEEGFNISSYKSYGAIDQYYCNQDKLIWAINDLYNLIKDGSMSRESLGPPTNM